MSELLLESSTYHYAVKAPGEGAPDAWPDLLKGYSKSLVYAPDTLSFDVHVTHEKGTVKVQNVRLSGPRVLKDGLSEHRVSESFIFEVPLFARKYIELAVAHQRRREGVAQLLGVPVERPEHRACRRTD